MNHISKTHQKFSRRLENPRVLENPEEFLGENFKAVLNFWLILDDLSKEQLSVVEERYWAFYNENLSEWYKATDLAYFASIEAIGKGYTIVASWAALGVTNSLAAHWATEELISMHKILEDHQQPLTFFPMFLEVL
jgi:hypothetical protein